MSAMLNVLRLSSWDHLKSTPVDSTLLSRNLFLSLFWNIMKGNSGRKTIDIERMPKKLRLHSVHAASYTCHNDENSTLRRRTAEWYPKGIQIFLKIFSNFWHVPFCCIFLSALVKQTLQYLEHRTSCWHLGADLVSPIALKHSNPFLNAELFKSNSSLRLWESFSRLYVIWRMLKVSRIRENNGYGLWVARVFRFSFIIRRWENCSF